MMTNNIGVLITNIGTPDKPTPKAVRQYLKIFLSDPRVVEIPRFIWWPILHSMILPTRAKKSAALYQKIWLNDESPLLYYSKRIAEKLQATLDLPVVLGMHYSQPSIATALNTLKAARVDKIIILPLYPQYSATTTAATFDQVSAVLKKWRHIPHIEFINQYASHPHYIKAISQSIETYWQAHGKAEHLLFSFHGIPKSFIEAGDPYQESCVETTRLVTEQLQLTAKQWSLAYQSRLGRAAWLTPYTDHVLKALPKQGIKHLQVICPGFATDCLETLEEIAIRGKKQFIAAGGESLDYIPALNDTNQHIAALVNIIQEHIIVK